jgi:hypothetical protein
MNEQKDNVNVTPGKRIVKLCSTKQDKDSEREYKISVTFDFTGVPTDDVYQYATSYLVINRAQSKFRGMSSSMLEALEKNGYLVKVAEGGRAPADPMTALRRDLGKIESKEDKLKLLEELQAEIEGQ